MSSTLSGKAQIVYHNAEGILEIEENKAAFAAAFTVIDSIWTEGLKSTRGDILDLGPRKFLFIDGTFDVYEWISGQWNNLYTGIFKGYNFGAKKFIFDGKIYSYGGYGYWHKHGQIIEFQEDRGEWEILPFSDGLPNGLASLDDGVLKIMGTDSYYRVYVKERTIQSKPHPFVVKSGTQLENHLTFEFDDYTINLGDKKPNYAIDKRTGKEYYSELSPFQRIRRTALEGFLYSYRNSIVCYSRDFEELASYEVQRELEFFALMEDEAAAVKSSKLIYWAAGFLPLILIGFFLYKKRRRTNGKAEDGVDYELLKSQEIINKLLPYKGIVLNQEELDKILEIDEGNSPEKIRYQRSQLIKEVNRFSQGVLSKDLIKRYKDPEDKRRYVYSILNIDVKDFYN